MAAPEGLTAQREQFRQAYSAIPRDSAPRADSKLLKEYVLYPYLQAARLLQELQLAPADAQLNQRIAIFIEAQSSAPAVRELRHAWLLSLASRLQWKTFLDYYRDDGDAELRCQNINALLATQREAEVAPRISPIWLTSERLAGACNAPFQWARDNQILTPALVEQRVRLALKNGNYQLANDLIDPLPTAQATPLRQWSELIEQPQVAIDALIAHPAVNVEAVALQDGWTRMSRRDPDAAIARLPRLIAARSMSAADASPYALSLALALAWNRRNESLEYFARVTPTDMTEQAHEWQARAALWRGDWRRVVKVIAAMPTALKSSVRWRYWNTRATEKLSGIAAAHASYEQLVATEDNYFAALAAARLHKPYVPHPIKFVADTVVAQTLASTPEAQRIRELVAVQLNSQANSEWNALCANLNTVEQLAAITVAHDWGWYDQTILLSAKLGQFSDYEFLYPRPYDTEVIAASKLSGLSTDFIYAQLRQESLYRRDAKSSAGALGLMQLLPSSARITARKLKWAKPVDEDLFNPTINVPLGAVHLKQMIDAFDGHTVLALAAYNAGPTNARRWIPDKAMDGDIWIENIPFNETRIYVVRVLWHSLIFNWLRTDQPVSAEAWLKPVKP